MRAAIIIVVALAVVYAVLTWIASSKFIHTRGKYARRDHDTAGLTEMTATTDDGLTLRGSFVEPPDVRGVLVLFHGIGAERYRGTLPRVASWGLVGVSFDFRGHGESDGDVTSFGWEERRDVAAIVAAIRARWPGKKIAAWGISLGGAALCYAADAVRDLDAVVLESVYRDIDSAFEKRVLTFAPAWTVPFTLPTKWLVSRRLGIDPTLLRPIDWIRRLRPERVLLTTGEKDPWAGPDDLGPLAAAAPHCSTYIVPGAVHNNVWVLGGDGYVDRVRAFLESRLR